jgi:hypothetical protein
MPSRIIGWSSAISTRIGVALGGVMECLAEELTVADCTTNHLRQTKPGSEREFAFCALTPNSTTADKHH